MTEEQLNRALAIMDKQSSFEWVIRECDKMDRELKEYHEREEVCRKKGATPRPPEIQDTLRGLLMYQLSAPYVIEGIEQIVEVLRKSCEFSIQSLKQELDAL